MTVQFLTHHGFRYAMGDENNRIFRPENRRESLLHKIWVTTLLVLFFLALFVFL